MDFTIYYYSFCFISCYTYLNYCLCLYYIFVIFYSYDEIMEIFYLCKRKSYYWRVELVDDNTNAEGEDDICLSYDNCPLLTL